MKKNLLIVLFLLLIVLIITVTLLYVYLNKEEKNRQSLEGGNEIILNEEPAVYQDESSARPAWARTPDGRSGPWEGDLYIAYSEDGLTFENEKLFLPHAGVPHILQISDGDLIATFQYFSFVNEELFDVIAYVISKDNGKSWSDIKAIKFDGLSKTKDSPNPVDPTLMEIEDGTFRLYYTYHAIGEKYPQFYSAVADSIEGKFVSQGACLEVDKMILDPAVVFFNDKWHHYTTYHGEKEGGKELNCHSTSNTGTEFTKQEDIALDMTMLGDVIEVDGKLRFYGTANGVKSAISEDGYEWEMESGIRINGADPGVVKLDDGRFMIIYTAMNPEN